MARLNMVDAIDQALLQAMERDPKIVVLGEDVGRDGGVFRADRVPGLRIEQAPTTASANGRGVDAGHERRVRVRVRDEHVPRDAAGGG